MSKFKVGDLVRLKSGGPTMVVDGYVSVNASTYENGTAVPFVQCTWFPTRDGYMTVSAGASGPFYTPEPVSDDFSEGSLEAVTK